MQFPSHLDQQFNEHTAREHYRGSEVARGRSEKIPNYIYEDENYSFTCFSFAVGFSFLYIH